MRTIVQHERDPLASANRAEDDRFCLEFMSMRFYAWPQRYRRI